MGAACPPGQVWRSLDMGILAEQRSPPHTDDAGPLPLEDGAGVVQVWSTDRCHEVGPGVVSPQVPRRLPRPASTPTAPLCGPPLSARLGPWSRPATGALGPPAGPSGTGVPDPAGGDGSPGWPGSAAPASPHARGARGGRARAAQCPRGSGVSRRPPGRGPAVERQEGRIDDQLFGDLVPDHPIAPGEIGRTVGVVPPAHRLGQRPQRGVLLGQQVHDVQGTVGCGSRSPHAVVLPGGAPWETTAPVSGCSKEEGNDGPDRDPGLTEVEPHVYDVLANLLRPTGPTHVLTAETPFTAVIPPVDPEPAPVPPEPVPPSPGPSPLPDPVPEPPMAIDGVRRSGPAGTVTRFHRDADG